VTALQLATLIRWAGTVRSRKRMQKVCLLLQANGCPLNLHYNLHSIGPYSEDLAHLTDEMTIAGLLEEDAEGPAHHQRFNYRLSQRTESRFVEIEKSGPPCELTRLAPYKALFRQLIATDVDELQLAATLVYLLLHGNERAQAIEQMSLHEGLSEFPDSALAIADRVMAKTTAVNFRDFFVKETP
jgi:hypothetical protein